MASLAKRAARNPEFGSAVFGLFGARRPSIEEIDRALRPLFVYRDENEEVIRTPEWMLYDLFVRLGHMEGDCDCISTLLAAMALVMDYGVRFVAVRYTRAVKFFEHVFVEINGGAGWRMVDLTVPTGTTIYALEVMTQSV